MATDVKNCGLILSTLFDSGVMSRKDMEVLRAKVDNASPAELATNQGLFDATFKEQIKDSIALRTQQVHDILKAKEMFESSLINGFSGERAKTMSEALVNLRQMFMGQNSLDSKRLVMEDRAMSELSHYEDLFQVPMNARMDTYKKGSDAAFAYYQAIKKYKSEITPEMLNAAKVKELLANATTDVERAALAKVAYNGFIRKEKARAGIAVKFNPDYVGKMRYDWPVLEEMGAEKFADTLVGRNTGERGLLNLEKTYPNKTQGDAKIEIKALWQKMKDNEGKGLDIFGGEGGSGNNANSKTRSFVWNDDKAEFDAYELFGEGSMYEKFSKDARADANSIFKTKSFGYDYKRVTGDINDRLKKHYGVTGELSVSDTLNIGIIKSAAIDMSGQNLNPSTGLTTALKAARLGTAAAKLGFALPGTVLDIVDNGRQAFMMDGALFGGMKNYVGNMAENIARFRKADQIKIANELSIMAENSSAEVGMRLANTADIGRKNSVDRFMDRHGNTMMNVATLLPKQTSMSKNASAASGLQHFTAMIDRMSKGEFSALHSEKFAKETLSKYGFSPEETALLAGGDVARVKRWFTPDHLTGRGVRELLQLPEPDIRRIADQLKVRPEQVADKIMALGDKIDVLQQDWMSRGTPQPGVGTKSLLLKTANHDERVRVGAGLFTQFLDTPISQVGTLVEVAQKSMRNGETGRFAAHMGIYVSAGIPLYLMADAAMSVALNRESLMDKITSGTDEQRREGWVRAIDRTGAAPFMVEMMANQMHGTRYNQTVLDSYQGSPVISTVQNVLKTLKPSGTPGAMTFKELALREGPMNSLVPRALNNWSDLVIGNKIIETRDKTRFNR